MSTETAPVFALVQDDDVYRDYDCYFHPDAMLRAVWIVQENRGYLIGEAYDEHDNSHELIDGESIPNAEIFQQLTGICPLVTERKGSKVFMDTVSDSTNKNCLEGLKCPRCGSFGPYKIDATVLAIVSDEGVEHVEDPDWNDQSSCTCCDCGHAATVCDFTIKEL